MFDFLIRNCLIVDGRQPPFPGSVGIVGEKIAAILEPATGLGAHREIDGAGQVLFPGVIDPHVHYRYDYGYRNGDEDYTSETRSALMGGVTTAIRMHRELTPYDVNIPKELEMLNSGSHIDIAFHLAIMTEEHLTTFTHFAEQYGINSFKLYLAYKGKAGQLQGLQGANDGFLYDAMRLIGQYPNGIACVHAENSEIAARLGDQLRLAGRNDLPAWTEARPDWAEEEAILRAGHIAHYAECPLYIVHISSAKGIEAVETLRHRGVQVYAEVCIQHLTTTIHTDLGLLAIVNPPLRTERDTEALWDALRRGVVDTIATDHVAHTKAKHRDSLWDVMPGFAGSATMLPALLSFGYHTGRLSLSEVARLTSSKAADIFRLTGKGQITVGADADLVLVDLTLERQVAADNLLSGSDYSLYEGQALKGWPTATISRGRIALEDDLIHVQPGHGKFICRH